MSKKILLVGPILKDSEVYVEKCFESFQKCFTEFWIKIILLFYWKTLPTDNLTKNCKICNYANSVY